MDSFRQKSYSKSPKNYRILKNWKKVFSLSAKDSKKHKKHVPNLRGKNTSKISKISKIA